MLKKLTLASLLFSLAPTASAMETIVITAPKPGPSMGGTGLGRGGSSSGSGSASSGSNGKSKSEKAKARSNRNKTHKKKAKKIGEINSGFIDVVLTAIDEFAAIFQDRGEGYSASIEEKIVTDKDGNILEKKKTKQCKVDSYRGSNPCSMIRIQNIRSGDSDKKYKVSIHLFYVNSRGQERTLTSHESGVSFEVDSLDELYDLDII
ncbi:hypothetical protein [Pseudobacteriovorax antillogorgiicola]|uniref:Uncharacterized protein n=1 Tax=Pseudobacteriovorax antillogorgiicola TaxID=1513793 RepID=A0A1Y6C9J7_9BACT|nr:hypothetical protein [Pseudobacteriovorax antillogorgiicola]TCS51742.1 hypothetical protein EDD56_110127 [Pseudobacteriovorax antillogorgiicola]SMF49646.1 hypothetical protein SAMN06296036_11596 [Pseudobacteriovorax antillogorgiicola]